VGEGRVLITALARAAGLLVVVALVVLGPVSSPAGAAAVYSRGSQTVAGAVTMQLGDTYHDDARPTIEERWAQLGSSHDLYRIGPVFAGDVLVFRWTSGWRQNLCIVDESVATRPCSPPMHQSVGDGSPTQLTVTATRTIARPMVRVEYGAQFTISLLSRQRPLTLTPYIYARGQRTDSMPVRARTSPAEAAPDGLPCQMVVVGPQPSDRFTYRSKVAGGRVVFAMSLPERLHGATVGYLVTCEGAAAVAGGSFEVVVK
jgi:hypothetical protein